ncbi:hypothetical protein [Streptomyces enissocaesilis]|uniref:Uncharacterized protein n=1 Tax=Streptomyces enissocaesilis TaxID=332589 RepID=A0ABN3XJL5_9ACTN
MTALPAAHEPGSGSFADRLPIGESLPVSEDSFVTGDTSPVKGEMRVKPLQAPVLPEPPRDGEDGPEDRGVCGRPVEDVLGADEHGRVDMAPGSSGLLGLPALVMLQPRGPYDLSDLPAGRAAGVGPMLQRVERAIMPLGGIARVHLSKGGGGARLRFWLPGRPAGMMRLRKTALSLREGLLPKVSDEKRRSTNRRIAATLAADGGKACIR